MASSSARSISRPVTSRAWRMRRLRVAAFAAEIEFVRAVGQLALVEMHAELDQLADARRAIRDDPADDRLVAEPRAGLERVLRRAARRNPPCS